MLPNWAPPPSCRHLAHDEALVEAMAERSLGDKHHSLSGTKIAKFIKDFKDLHVFLTRILEGRILVKRSWAVIRANSYVDECGLLFIHPSEG